jgi:sugar phosphate isomerase/epimerase
LAKISVDQRFSVGEAIRSAGFAMPMLCCSPDFTQPDPAARQRSMEHEAEMVRITRRLGGPRAVCRVLSGQRRPEVRTEDGIEWVVDCIQQLLPIARQYDVILGMENHYKDGFWKFPEFAQKKKEVFMKILHTVPDRKNFGVQDDPSNAIVAGDDPLDWLVAVQDRVVSMHASDRWLSDGATIEDLRQSDGTLGCSPKLNHGVIGKGLNDYLSIFGLLAEFRTVDRARFQAIDPVAHYHALQIQDFLQAIRAGRPPLVTGEDGRAVVETFSAIKISMLKMHSFGPPSRWT